MAPNKILSRRRRPSLPWARTVLGLHWSMAVICHPGLISALLAAGNGATKAGSKVVDVDDEERPCIIITDSCHECPHPHEGIAENLRIWIVHEWHRQCADESEAPLPLSKDSLPLVVLNVPQQNNAIDCGLYALRSAESFLVDVLVKKVAVTRGTIKTNLNAFKAKSWFKAADIQKFRKEYTSLVERMTTEFRAARTAARVAAEGTQRP
jgi:Ulp1 family protease